MRCCTYRKPHRHYASWLRDRVVSDPCKCGAHPRTWTVGALFAAWKTRR